MTWVVTGDSITQGVLHTHGARSWVEHVHERIRWQLGRLTDIVINAGVSGWTSTDVLASYDHLIGRFSPDVLSISLGTNDAYYGIERLAPFRAAMHALIAKSDGAQIIVHTPVPVTQAGKTKRPDLPAFSQAVREIATETGALLVDHEAYWLAEFGDADALAWLDEDPAHSNALGHLHMANHTLRTIGLDELSAP